MGHSMTLPSINIFASWALPILSLVFAVATAAQTLSGVSILPSKGIGPLALGMTTNEIRSAAPRDWVEGQYDDWVVDGRRIAVLFKGGIATQISTSSPKFRTPGGIRIGTKIDDLKSAYLDHPLEWRWPPPFVGNILYSTGISYFVVDNEIQTITVCKARCSP